MNILIDRVYKCKKCGEEFTSYGECFMHMQKHIDDISCKCSKCGKELKYNPMHTDNDYPDTNCIHEIDLGVQGYGSSLDGCNVKFILCDECLTNVIKSLDESVQEEIFNG